MRQTFLIISLLLANASCITPMDSWNKGYPKTAKELKTDEAKKAEFNKFAISPSSTSYYIQTQEEKGTKHYYSRDSFQPIVTKVSPETNKQFDEMLAIDKYKSIALGVAFVGLLLAGTNYNASSILMAGGLGSIIGLEAWQMSVYSDLKSTYHRDLNHTIYGSSEKKTSSNSKISEYTLGLSFNL